MANKKNIRFFFLCFIFSLISNAIETSGKTANGFNTKQIDSLIKERSADHEITKLDLLVLYEDALTVERQDSVEIYKKLAVLNAELEQPKDTYVYTEKYINNTLDFSILKDGSYHNIKNTAEYKKLNDKYITHIDLFDFIYFYVALIGFFFTTTLIFRKKTNRTAKLFIGGFVIANSIFILEFVLYVTNYQYQFPHTYRMSAAAALLFGPFLHLYFKSVTESTKLGLKDLIHFFPTVILLLFLAPLYMLSASDKVRMMLEIHPSNLGYDLVIFISKILSLMLYAIFMKKLVFGQIKKDASTYSVEKWKINLYRIHIAYVTSYLIYGLSVFGALGSFSSIMYHLQLGAMCIIIVYIAYMAYVQPDIFNNAHVPLMQRLFSEKYQKSGLTDSLSRELKESLVKLLTEEKIYKTNNINLDMLAEKLNTTRHNTSQIINEHFEMNFFELINKFRIKEATDLLEKDTHGNLNIIDVAYEVGYNNKVTFNKAFKKETTFTPSEYINAKLQEHKQVNSK
ncbi:helix-turn-helix domain-containing protein [Flavobacteriaceae bacterium XHP0103]|uniref:helix-turn-helix domain-containing protein n=1 Tax=Marixanthotalea marina TaxID=2844359 RepID=UPI002989AB3C|nr:helix-turn-helix domain-containing protein [Marixanthotalea marina]MBU3821955.1 helix-turn-helix domain-containing protein [Marixanthotalea marina]